MSKIAQTIAVLGVVAGLGVAALPLSSYAQEETIDIMASVDGTLGMSVTSNEVKLGTLLAGGNPSTGDVKITVNTTDSHGYTLSMIDSDANTALVAVDTEGNAIAGGVSIAAGTPAVGVSAWGYKVNNAAAYQQIVAAGGEAAQLAKTTANGEGNTTLTFGVSASAEQASGSYKGSVVVTAVVNEGE